MEKLDVTLKSLLKELGIEKEVKKNQVLIDWPVIVGRRVAEVSKAEKLEEKVLFVKVSHSTWRHELLYQKADIISKINKKIGQEMVKEIRLY